MTGFVSLHIFLLVLNIGRITVVAQEQTTPTTKAPSVNVTTSSPGTGTNNTATQPPTTGVTETTDYYYDGLYTPPVTPELYKKLSNCSTPETIENYCKGQQSYLGYFQGGGSTYVSDILSRVINSTIVKALQEQCVPGNWCLSDSFQQKMSAGKNAFYASPLCQSDILWKCLLSIEPFREKCNENELLYLTSTLSLMCDIDVISGMMITTQCYTRTLEAVHVLYSDLTRTVKITHTYDCAMETCSKEQQVFLADFGPWTLVDSFTKINPDKCVFTLQCQHEAAGSSSHAVTNKPNQAVSDLQSALDNKEVSEENKINDKIEEVQNLVESEQEIEKIEDEIFGDSKSTQPPQQNPGSEQGMDTPMYGPAGQDQTFVYGMVTVSIVVVVGFLLIGILTFKQITKRRKNYKLGYSQMTEEESRMLKSEYN